MPGCPEPRRTRVFFSARAVWSLLLRLRWPLSSTLIAYSCLVARCMPCMTCGAPRVSKAERVRDSVKRHRTHGGVGSFAQDIPKLKVVYTETTIYRTAARL